MRAFHIIVLGQVSYWFQMVRKAANEIPEVDRVQCFSNLGEFLGLAQVPDSNTLFLINGSEQATLIATAQELRTAGWQFIIFVAANPSVKGALTIFRNSLGYDYWEMTYDTIKLSNMIINCIREIMVDKLSK